MMRVICQFKIWTIIVLSLFVLSSKGQVYQSMPQYGYSGPRFNMDSTLSIPTVCGVPTLKSNLTKKAAIAFDSCNNRFYQYNPKTSTWSQISGNVVSVAVDTIYKNSTKDSIIFTINGRRRAIKDSIGSGGGSPGGSNGYVQFNNGGSFGGSSALYWNNGESKLGIGGVPEVPLDITENSQSNNTAEFGTIGIQSYDINNAWIGDNVYFNGTFFTRRNSGYAGLFYFRGNEGQFRWGDDGVQGAGVTNGKSQNGVVSLKTNLSGMFAVGDMSSVTSDTAGANFVVDGSGNVFIPKLTKSTKINVVGYDTITKKLTYQAAGSGTTIDTTSLSNRIDLKVNISDTGNMLSKYLRKTDTTAMLNPYLRKIDTTAMLTPYLRKIDTTNKFVSSVTKLNDSSIRVIKGTTTSDISITSVANATNTTRLTTIVYNNSGATITKGSVVYINGRHSSNYPTIALAQANTEVNSYSTFAMVQSDITNNSTGIVIQAGNISNLNLPTATYTDGDLLYLSPTVAGGITKTKPLAPYHIVKIGTVTRAHPTLGSIELKIENGWQLDELSDVQIAAVPADYSVLQFRRTDSLWHDITLSNVIGTKVDTIYKNDTKDSIVFTINNVRYAINDSIGSGGGGAGNPAGSNGYIQFNDGGSFGADSALFWNNTNKRFGLGTTQPQNKFDIVSGNQTGKMNRGFYETATFSRDGDNKVGIYNAGNYNGTGSSISFGNIKNKNLSNYYPGFELQNVNDSEVVENSFMRYNFTQRDSTGQVLDAAIDLMNIYSNGIVQINGNGTYSSISVNPRLIIGNDDQGASLEVAGNAFIGNGLTVNEGLISNGIFTTNSGVTKHITFWYDSIGGTDYYVETTDHIVIFKTTEDNGAVYLPSDPIEGQEIIIKQSGATSTYALQVYGNSHDIWYSDAIQGDVAVPDIAPHSITFIYGSGYWYVID